MFNPIKAALESIDFQSGALFAELTMAFQALRKIPKGDIADSEEAHNLSAIIANSTGLKISLEFGDMGPAVEIPAINKNNVLINSYIRAFNSSSDGLRLIGEAGGMVRGSVDLAKSKASGVFSEVSTKLHMPLDMVSDTKFTEEELAAVALHEIGHIFTYYEFITRSMTTNQVLAGISKALAGVDDIKVRESVLLSAKKALRLKDLDAAALAKSKSSTVVEAVIITSVAQQSHSELGSNIYDISSWEYLCDQFAARHGAGRHLVTALDKIYRGSKNISFRSTPGFLAIEAFKLILLIIAIAQAPFLLVAVLTMFAADGRGIGDYDTPEARFKRVRNQIVENLKDTQLSKDDHDRLTADLITIDEILANVNDRRQFFGVLWDAFNIKARKARSQELLQKELEEIAANELFVKAAALRQMA